MLFTAFCLHWINCGVISVSLPSERLKYWLRRKPAVHREGESKGNSVLTCSRVKTLNSICTTIKIIQISPSEKKLCSWWIFFSFFHNSAVWILLRLQVQCQTSFQAMNWSSQPCGVYLTKKNKCCVVQTVQNIMNFKISAMYCTTL